MKKILVVDDDYDQRDIYQDLFKQSGFEVIIGDDGLDAYQKIPKFKPDLVFTGIMMPRMDGFELIKKLRSEPATLHIPVILFSHLGREEDRKKAQSIPQVDFMVKGTDKPITILNRVKDLLSSDHKMVDSFIDPASKSVPMV